MQEVITMVAFAGFSVADLKVPMNRNSFFVAMLLAGAADLIVSEKGRSARTLVRKQTRLIKRTERNAFIPNADSQPDRTLRDHSRLKW